jgi:hypothetical protein
MAITGNGEVVLELFLNSSSKKKARSCQKGRICDENVWNIDFCHIK